MPPLQELRTQLAERAACIPQLRHAPRPLVATAVALQLAIGISPLLFMVFSSSAVGRVAAAAEGGTGSAAWDAMQRDLVLSAAVLVLAQVLAPAQLLLTQAIQLRIDVHLYGRLMAANFSDPGTAAMEHPEVRAAVEDAVAGLRFQRGSTGSAAAASVTLLARYIGFVGSLGIIAVSFHWAAAILAACGGLALRVTHRRSFLVFTKAFEALYPERRRHWHLHQTTLSPALGKEARVFGAAGWLADQATDAAIAFRGPLAQLRSSIFLRPFVYAGAVCAGGGVLVLAALAWPATGGELPAGQVLLVAQAVIGALGIGAFFEESDVETTNGMAHLRMMEKVEAAASVHRTEHQAPSAELPPGLPSDSIRFEGVTFGYPGSAGPVLSGFDLELKAGTSLAVVGVNGAGKTTLIKLLCRFYEPSAGRISADGTELREYDAASWQRRIAAVFQDFGRYPLSAADNIGFGAAEHVGDREHIRRAAAHAGADGYLDELDEGLDTVLSREFRGGTDLSGGQWQRVALARALLAVEAGAGVLVLDEPTASLDVRAEADFIDRFLDLTKGTTTIVVSHRFATVRRADRIVVLDGGRIVEDGNHDELMAVGGRYAEMFEIQAARFTTAAGEGE
ncbi:ABC transporter ATP-binding protein [Streptomyces sp900116325]|uniref:ABC transporter ATP-binding protein n=1 Tax=Streptomyces sp. 900116325 TaxID=3154295 RepID=UPI0033BAB3F3